MKISSLEPFIPSGSDFSGSKQFFTELGFSIKWDVGDYVGFEKDGIGFILQQYDNKQFAENLMMSVRIDDVYGFRQEVLDKKLPERFGIKVGNITAMPYGQELNIIDPAGVCWHFVQ